MKKLKLVSSLMALFLAVMVLNSCNDESSEVDPILDDTELIAAIASAKSWGIRLAASIASLRVRISSTKLSVSAAISNLIS